MPTRMRAGRGRARVGREQVRVGRGQVRVAGDRALDVYDVCARIER